MLAYNAVFVPCRHLRTITYPQSRMETTMHRRDFIKLTAALGAATSLPLWSRAALAADFSPL
ncbi:twin-arginine translocation signal domain-containing protein, partial [Yersinia enterocolitica]|uniref:twin-arginine translocation signal domain-containing protein n=1 Tax=Yersinia enterocolitica TaxID=630 RepID=UPI003AB6327B